MPERMEYCPFRMTSVQADDAQGLMKAKCRSECALFVVEGLGGGCAFKVAAKALESIAVSVPR